jgi:hypothetical protein
LSTANEGVELGRDPHVTTAAVRPAHERNDGRAATRAAKRVVRNKEVLGDGFPKRRAAVFERVCHAFRQRPSPRESTIDFGKFGQCTHGSLDRHRPAALASGSSRRSSAETASKMASASEASRTVFTTSPSANIWESLWSQGR